MMRRYFNSLIALLCVLTSVAMGSVSVTDDGANLITLERPAKRIVSLAPHITEALFSIGAGDAVVGVDNSSDYPKAVKSLPHVGKMDAVDIERIVSLRPDIVFAWTDAGQASKLKALAKFKIPVFYTDEHDMKDIAMMMGKFGVLTGHWQSAHDEVRSFLDLLHKLQNKNKFNARRRVFIQIWSKPLMTVNQYSFVSQAVKICGGENIFANQAILAPQVNQEAVIKSNPDVIIGMVPKADLQKTWGKWPAVAAVKNHKVYAVMPDLLSRPGPRILAGIQSICQLMG